MKIGSKHVVLFFFIGFACVFAVIFAFLLFANANGNWRFVSDAAVTEFHLCQGWDQENNLPLGMQDTVYTDAKYFVFCGKLNSDLPVKLNIYVYREGISHPILTNGLGDRFAPGSFIRMLEINDPLTAGKYRADVYFNRSLLATTEFEAVQR